MSPRYLDPSTVEYCERCRCKTWHLPLPSGQRCCEYHLPEALPRPEPSAQPQPAETRP